MSDRRVLCSCAITGGMSVPGQSAAIPVTPEQIVDSAVAAHAAGAAIVHLHVRGPQMATFNCGSFNFGIFGVKPRPEMAEWEVEYLDSTRDYVSRNTFKDIY